MFCKTIGAILNFVCEKKNVNVKETKLNILLYKLDIVYYFASRCWFWYWCFRDATKKLGQETQNTKYYKSVQAMDQWRTSLPLQVCQIHIFACPVFGCFLDLEFLENLQPYIFCGVMRGTLLRYEVTGLLILAFWSQYMSKKRPAFIVQCSTIQWFLDSASIAPWLQSWYLWMVSHGTTRMISVSVMGTSITERSWAMCKMDIHLLQHQLPCESQWVTSLPFRHWHKGWVYRNKQPRLHLHQIQRCVENRHGCLATLWS